LPETIQKLEIAAVRQDDGLPYGAEGTVILPISDAYFLQL